MKKTAVVNLLCSVMIVTVIVVAVAASLIFSGAITLEPEELVISSKSVHAYYTGQPLINTDYTLESGTLREGHTLSVRVSGSQTNVGISENYIEATVLDKAGADVTDDYKITYKPGALNVKPREITVTAASEMRLYSGTALVNDGFSLKPASALLPGDRVVATVEGEVTDIGTAINRITSVAILNRHDIDVTHNYNVKTVDGHLVVFGAEDLVLLSGSAECEYTPSLKDDPLVCHSYEIKNGRLLGGDRIEVIYTGKNSTPGTVENTYTAKVLDPYGNDVSAKYNLLCDTGTLEVTKVGEPLTIKTATEHKVADGTPLSGKSITTKPYFLGNELSVKVTKNGVTMSIEEALNKEQTIPGFTTNDFTSGDIRILDRTGQDVTDAYDVELEFGTLTVHETPETLPTPITITTGDAKKMYDGTPLTEQSYKILEGELKAGHYAVVDITGEIRDIGRADNDYTVTIRDENGNDVTDEYHIKQQYGLLEVTKPEITLTAASAQKVWDGEPLSAPDYEVSPSKYKDIFTFDVKIVGSIIEVGEMPNVIASCRIYDKEGKDFTPYVTLKTEKGLLKVVETEEELSKELTFTSESAALSYTGLPQSHKVGELENPEALREGHRYELFFTERTEIGVYENTIEAKIFNEENEDVTSEYTIKYKPGTLEIKRIEIEISSEDGTWEYNGIVKTRTDYSQPSGLLDGHTLEMEIVGEILYPDPEERGRPNTISSWRVTDGEGNDVTHLYAAAGGAPKEGTLTVKPREIVLYVAPAEKVYDGTPLRADTVHTGIDKEGQPLLHPDGLPMILPEHTLTYGLEGEITTVDENGKEATISWYKITDKTTGEKVQNSLYRVVETVPAALTIHKRPLTITAKSIVKDYSDGEALANPGAYVGVYWDDVEKTEKPYVITVNGVEVNQLPEGHTGTASTMTCLDNQPIKDPTEPGEYQSIVSPYSWTIMNGENNVTSSFYVTTVDGTLTIKDYEPVYTVTRTGGSGTQVVYLKEQSWGNYSESTLWAEVPTGYPGTMDDGTPLFFTHSAVYSGDSKYKTERLHITPEAGRFAMPYYAASGSVTGYGMMNGDVGFSGITANVSYTVDYYFGGALESVSLSTEGNIRAKELDYRKYAYDNYLSLEECDAKTLASLNTLIGEKGFVSNISYEDSASSWDSTTTIATILAVQSYIQTAATYNLEYNPKLDSADNIVKAFLETYQEGVSRHYATVATLLLRALGFPARYTTGYATPTEVGKEVKLTDKKEHAWVEVYINGIGWHCLEVTGRGAAANGTDGPVRITVTPNAINKVVTPTSAALSAEEIAKMQPGVTSNTNAAGISLSTLKNEGYTYEYQLSGEVSGLGNHTGVKNQGVISIASFIIKDRKGNVVYDSADPKAYEDKFVITLNKGTVWLYLGTLEFESAGDSWEYDGTWHQLEVDQILTKTGLAPEYAEEYTVHKIPNWDTERLEYYREKFGDEELKKHGIDLSKITETGTGKDTSTGRTITDSKYAAYTIIITKEVDGEVVLANDHFKITSKMGYYEVEKKAITVKPADIKLTSIPTQDQLNNMTFTAEVTSDIKLEKGDDISITCNKPNANDIKADIQIQSVKVIRIIDGVEVDVTNGYTFQWKKGTYERPF